MATEIMLRHPSTGLSKKGFYGFSWTTFLFGPFPAMFRGDWLVAIGLFVGAIFLFWIPSIIAAFVYNKYYTTRLIERGYVLSDNDDNNKAAMTALGIIGPN